MPRSLPLRPASRPGAPVPGLAPVRPGDIPELMALLHRADLTSSGLGDPTVRLWLLRDTEGRMQAAGGYELSKDGGHALIRSVAVDVARRGEGLGRWIAGAVLDRAVEEGARHAWLFSRRCGAFWRRIGFQPADRGALTGVFADSHQVRLFRSTGQLQEEVAWWRSLVWAPDGPRHLVAAADAPSVSGPARLRTWTSRPRTDPRGSGRLT